MMMAARCIAAFLVISTMVNEVYLSNEPYRKEYKYSNSGEPKTVPYDSDNEYIHQIHSMIDDYRSDTRDRMMVETNDNLIDTEYRKWKRNADIINSLLALPKGMNDAGRR